MLSAGQMSDAAEVLMAIYEHLTPVAARALQPQLLDDIFGLHVQVASYTHAQTCVSHIFTARLHELLICAGLYPFTFLHLHLVGP